MSDPATANQLLLEEIKDLYSAETQLLKALPKMAEAASDPHLQDAFKTHLAQTEIHAKRLEEIAEMLGEELGGQTCKAMKGLIEEGAEKVALHGDPNVKDLALIIAAQKAEHYEISGYGSVRTLAEFLELDEIAAILSETEDEEGDTDKILTKLAESILPQTPQGDI